MQKPEKYWLYKAPPIPGVRDLPEGSFNGGGEAWCSLSPGMRRTIWRDAVHDEARKRQLPPDILSRLKTATISGTMGSLDAYLAEFKRVDAARMPIREDAERLTRAESMHRQSAAQIAGREAL